MKFLQISTLTPAHPTDFRNAQALLKAARLKGLEACWRNDKKSEWCNSLGA